MREFLKGLDLDKETIDTIMAEHGKYITELKENNMEMEEQIKEYTSKIDTLNSQINADTKLREELETLKSSIATDNEVKKIDAALSNRQFTSKYAKDGFYNDVKTELEKPENEGKDITEIIEYLSKDQEGIFVNPNALVNDMASVENVDMDITKETFNNMSYNDRIKLKAENPELFKKLNN